MWTDRQKDMTKVIDIFVILGKILKERECRPITFLDFELVLRK